MVYRITRLGALILALVSMAGAGCVAQEAAKTLTVGAITVSYPAGMETQAKKVGETMDKALKPGLEIHRQIASMLADPGEVAKQIAELLGADEVLDATRGRLATYKQKSDALVGCFSNVKLVRTSDAVATAGVDAGVLQVRYQREQNEFAMALQLDNANAATIKRSYMPIFINPDGTIRAQDKIGDLALDFLGSSRAMLAAPVHETVVWIMSDKLNIYHPFTRWFVEGVSGWVTTRVLTKFDSGLAPLTTELFTPGPMAKKIRDKVNLLAWPQSAFQNKKEPYIDPALEVAQTQYSVQAVTEVLAGNRNKTLARIVDKVKHGSDADTDAICEAIKEVTLADFNKTFTSYIPHDIKLGIDSGESKKLIAQADKLTQEKKWKDAVAKLRKALQMTPTDLNALLNLAWLERETNERYDSEIQVFLAARLLKQQQYSFHLFAPSIEGNYILGRLAILVGNLEQARKFLEPVLQVKPDHPDAKRAMEEIKQLEGATKG